ncbi:IclR family transcriptional regulator [Pseudonocardia xishanensis]|uniref:IclR family transcriptional regulator n=1 Tax=Pseudonocardia xishanensis TaxID=630995 RepID=A0ABP8RUZ2_9PSEU
MPDVEAAKPATSMRSLERAIDVLEVLDSGHHPLRLSEIARRAGLPVATTQRILGVLEARGRVEKDAVGYRPGVGLIFGAHAYLAGNPMLTAARPILQDLAGATGLTASLFRRLGWSRVVLARVEGGTPLRYELPIGERLPLHVGGGKTLAAFMDEEETAAFLAQVEPHTRADGVVVTSAELAAELAEVRAVGYSTARGDREPGMASVAVPVPEPDNLAMAAIQVTGSQADIPLERIPELGAELKRAALAISRRTF